MSLSTDSIGASGFWPASSASRWGSTFSPLANFAIGNKPLRWLFEKVFELSARRRLPRVARRSFLSLAKRRGWTIRPNGARPWLVYFPDLYATFIDPQIGEATVLVLQHHGYDVYVPPQLRGSGIEALAHGDVETARDNARRNLRVLADLAREGITIVCSEPSSALMLRQDYIDLLDDLDARLVSQKSVELTAFLGDLKRQGKLRTDFQSLSYSVGHHVPCHIKALGQPAEGPSLLHLIPGMRVAAIDVELLRHGWHIWPQGEQLRHLAGGRQTAPGGAGKQRYCLRSDRM